MKTWRVCLANSGEVWDGISDRLLFSFIRDLQATYKGVDLKIVMREVDIEDQLNQDYLWELQNGELLSGKHLTPEYGRVNGVKG